MNDDVFVRRFRDRNESVLADTKDLYGSYCHAIAWNILRDEQDAEECVNEALLAAWNSIPPQQPENLKIYLGKLSREIAIDRWRKKHAQKRIPASALLCLDELEEVVGTSQVETSVEVEALSRQISVFLRSLRETERNVFVRRYWYCDSVENICTRYGFGKSKVLMMLKRTRDRLAEYLKKEGYLI